MTGTYAALLYSIGINGNSRLIMADWRSMMDELGLQKPRTLIASGNAIFESRTSSVRKLEAQLEDAFECRLGGVWTPSYAQPRPSAAWLPLTRVRESPNATAPVSWSA